MSLPEWNLADAKNRFSEVVRRALSKGPQRVNRRGEAVVVIAAKDYERLAGKKKSFKELLVGGPKIDDLDSARAKDLGRDVEL